MDISSIDLAPISPVKIDAVTEIPVNPVALDAQSSTNVITANASIVSFSPLAQLLAATALTQSQLARAADGGAPGGFNQLAADTTQFVTAFNDFQTSITTGNGNIFDATFDSALLQEIRLENSPSGSNTRQSFINRLAELGINFQDKSNPPTTNSINPNHLSLDLAKLEAGFNANAAQTSAQLLNAFQALGALEEGLVLAQQSAQHATQYQNFATSGTGFTAGTQANLLSNPDAQAVSNTLQSQRADLALADARSATAQTTNLTGNTTTVATANATAAAQTATAGQAANHPANDTISTTANANAVVRFAEGTAGAFQSGLNPAVLAPAIAVAVSAYLIGETAEHVSSPTISVADTNEEVGKIPPIAALASDLHGSAANNPTTGGAGPNQHREHQLKRR